MFIRSLALFGLVALPTLAATPEEVAQVANMVTDTTVPAVARQTFVFAGTGEINGYQAVFICDGMRYTVYNSGERIVADDPTSAWLAFWVRKNGTSGQEALDTFSDDAFDGTVDLGIDGRRQKEYLPDDESNLEHRAYWQERLDAAVTALITCAE